MKSDYPEGYSFRVFFWTRLCDVFFRLMSDTGRSWAEGGRAAVRDLPDLPPDVERQPAGGQRRINTVPYDGHAANGSPREGRGASTRSLHDDRAANGSPREGRGRI